MDINNIVLPIPDIIKKDNWEMQYSWNMYEIGMYFCDKTDSNKTLASIELEKLGKKYWLNYKLVGANPTSISTNKNEIYFKDCFDGVDLKYECSKKSLKETIILNKRPDRNEFIFTLKSNDLTITKDDVANELSFKNDKGAEVFTFNRPFIIDNSGEENYNVAYEISDTIYNDVSYKTISVKIDDSILDSIQYPAMIDPTAIPKPSSMNPDAGSVYSTPIMVSSNYYCYIIDCLDIYMSSNYGESWKYCGYIDNNEITSFCNVNFSDKTGSYYSNFSFMEQYVCNARSCAPQTLNIVTYVHGNSNIDGEICSPMGIRIFNMEALSGGQILKSNYNCYRADDLCTDYDATESQTQNVASSIVADGFMIFYCSEQNPINDYQHDSYAMLIDVINFHPVQGFAVTSNLVEVIDVVTHSNGKGELFYLDGNNICSQQFTWSTSSLEPLYDKIEIHTYPMIYSTYIGAFIEASGNYLYMYVKNGGIIELKFNLNDNTMTSYEFTPPITAGYGVNMEVISMGVDIYAPVSKVWFSYCSYTGSSVRNTQMVWKTIGTSTLFPMEIPSQYSQLAAYAPKECEYSEDVCPVIFVNKLDNNAFYTNINIPMTGSSVPVAFNAKFHNGTALKNVTTMQIPVNGTLKKVLGIWYGNGTAWKKSI